MEEVLLALRHYHPTSIPRAITNCAFEGDSSDPAAKDRGEVDISNITPRPDPSQMGHCNPFKSAICDRSRYSFATQWIETAGDKDKRISLRELGATNLFTKELDEALIQGQIRLAIHSAKDLPEPLAEGLTIAALTRGLDARDALVLRPGTVLQPGMRIATSSERREEAVRALCQGVVFTDVRGTIGERLALLDSGVVDGVVIAEAALIRLQLTALNRILLPGSTAQGQGKLAILCKESDVAMRKLLRCLDSRRRVLYLGTDPARFACEGTLVHYPVIQTTPIEEACQLARTVWPNVTHVVFTSPNAVKHWEEPLLDKTVIAIGEGTAARLRKRGVEPLVAPFATQEGVIALFSALDLSKAFLLWPRSSGARPLLERYLEQNQIRFLAVDTYVTTPHAPGPLPDLNTVDEIVFTSPSTLDAYLKVFGALPSDKVLTPIGPITAAHLAKMFQCAV